MGKVPVRPLKNIVKEKVDYIVIDVEGHEVEVIKGMNLKENSHLFPIIQVELGGTWIDPRRSSVRMSQSEFVAYLEEIGYQIFLMGETKLEKKGVLLPVNAAMIRDARTDIGSNGFYYVQGNIVAIKADHIRIEFWKSTKENVQKSVKTLKNHVPF